MRGWLGRSKRPTNILESAIIGDGSADEQAFKDKLDAALDRVLGLISPSIGLMAEVLLAVPRREQVITARLRPDISVALPIRMRAGEGIIGKVYQSGQPFAGDLPAANGGGIGSAGDAAHLLRTRSSLVVVLQKEGRKLGVLNIESAHPGVFPPAAIRILTESRPFTELVDLVATSTPQTLSEDQIARDLIDRLRQQVAFAIDPGDIESTYYQILQVSAQIINAPDVSGGLILVRDDSLRLTSVSGAPNGRPGARRYWAVRAAQLGAFNSDLEWALEGQSIARRVIETRTSALVPDVREDHDYRDSGTRFAQSSELIVPLLAGEEAIGVIGLVCPRLNAFTSQDQRHLEEVARIAVEAIKRSEQIRAARRGELQQQLSRELLRDLQELFPKNVQDILRVDIKAFQQRVYREKILHWGREYTESEHAAIVLAEVTEGRPTYLTVHADLGEHIDRPPPRWLASEGVTGQAYTSGDTATNPDLPGQAAANFVPYYKDARSEVAAPMKRGEEIMGTLDVESTRSHHYTTEHVRWVEFLAEQTAFVLIAVELALKTQLELRLERLARAVNESAQRIRGMGQGAVDQVRPERDGMLRHVLEEIRAITRSSVGRIVIAMNAYMPNDVIDTRQGVLYYMISTDPAEVSETARRYFPITDGISGLFFEQGYGEQGAGADLLAFKQREKIIFNDEQTRDSIMRDGRRAYFPGDASRTAGRNSRSGMFIPLYEGARRVGVVNFEAEHQDAYPSEFVALGQRASEMISQLLVVTRLRLSRLLADLLRQFETDILKIEKPDLEGLMQEVLRKTSQLSDIKDGWGQITLLRPTANPDLLVASRTFSMRYRPDATGEFDPGTDDERAPIEYSVFRDAIKTKQPVLILDTDLQSDEQRRHMPWERTRSLICVPLLQPVAGQGAQADEERITGILAVASPRRSEFSEADKEVLRPFAQTVVYGLRSIALLGARKDLMDEVLHDFSKALPSVIRRSAEFAAPLAAARAAPDLTTARQYIDEMTGKMTQFNGLVRLTTSMMNWFYYLADETIVPEQDTSAALDARDILKDLEVPVNALAWIRRRFSVRFPPAEPLYIAGGAERQELIGAVLFKYLDNAIKYSDQDDVTVSLNRRAVPGKAPVVRFAVSNSGKPIPERDRELIFELRYRPSSTASNVMGSGIGLFQAREIARKLGGEVGYEPDAAGHNIFWLALPFVLGAPMPAGR